MGSMGHRVRQAAIVVVGVTIATAAVAVLESVVGVPDASSVYLVAVVLSAMTAGTAAALATAVAAILTYDLLFTEPFLTPVITDTGEWLSLLLFSFVGISVGQLVAVQRRRTGEAIAREREAQDLHSVTRLLAARATTADALGGIARVLADRLELERVWFALGEDDASERVVADTGSGPVPLSGSYAQLRRPVGGTRLEWLQLHAPRASSAPPPRSDVGRLRVPIEAAGTRLGSLWATRRRSGAALDATTSRLLSAAADQVGLVVRQDRLADQAAEARIARESSALKSVLMESVSHDLRTPLASIRASAGTLMHAGEVLDRGEVALAAAAIDRQAERLDRLVTNLLDLGRIQAGALRVTREAVELRELVTRARERLAEGDAPSAARTVDVEVEDAWVEADAVLLEQTVLNLLENAFRHTPPEARVRVTAAPVEGGAWLRLRVEDAGPGMPPGGIERLFERRPLRRPLRIDRIEAGLGLTIVRGFVEAMGGRVNAGRSEMGGLAIDVELAAMHLPAGFLVAP